MSSVRLSRHALTHMLAKKWGRILWLDGMLTDAPVRLPDDHGTPSR